MLKNFKKVEVFFADFPQFVEEVVFSTSMSNTSMYMDIEIHVTLDGVQTIINDSIVEDDDWGHVRDWNTGGFDRVFPACAHVMAQDYRDAETSLYNFLCEQYEQMRTEEDALYD